MSIIPPSKKPGFTLIEIVIVLAIAALIMVVVFVAASGALMARRNDQRRSDARLVLAAVESNPELYDAAIANNTNLSALTRRLLGVATFQDPTQTENKNNDQSNSIPGSKDYIITNRSALLAGINLSGVSPKIEISRNAKCKKVGNNYRFEESPGSNAVNIVLEPISAKPSVGTQYQMYGTLYCINT